MGDLSSQSGDHGVTVNPAAASRIDVVRGPATLLYGANAIGGLVNVITEDIPTRRIEGADGNVTFDVGSAAKEAGAAVDHPRRQRQLRVARRRRRPSIGRRRDTRRRTRQLAVTERLRQPRRCRGPGTEAYFGGSYGYDDTQVRHPDRRGRRDLSSRRAVMRSRVRGGGQGLTGALRLVPGHALGAALQARRARRGRSRHRVQEQHGGARADGRAPRRRPAEGTALAAGSSIARSARAAPKRSRPTVDQRAVVGVPV